VVAVSAPIPRPGPPSRPVSGPPQPAAGHPDGAGSSNAGPFGAAGSAGAGDPAGSAGSGSSAGASGLASPLGAGSPVGQGGAASTVAAVQASVADLDQLDDLPVVDHVARYDALHGTLSEALAAIDGV